MDRSLIFFKIIVDKIKISDKIRGIGMYIKTIKQAFKESKIKGLKGSLNEISSYYNLFGNLLFCVDHYRDNEFKLNNRLLKVCSNKEEGILRGWEK